jgi:cell division protein FtsN
MNSRLFFAISVGIFVGGACLYLFIKHHEKQEAANATQEQNPARGIGFAAIMAEQKGQAATA